MKFHGQDMVGTAWRRRSLGPLDRRGDGHVAEVVFYAKHPTDAAEDEIVLRCTSLCVGHPPTTELWRRGKFGVSGHVQVADTNGRSVVGPEPRSIWRCREYPEIVRVGAAYDDNKRIAIAWGDGQIRPLHRSDFFKHFYPVTWSEQGVGGHTYWNIAVDETRELTAEEASPWAVAADPIRLAGAETACAEILTKPVPKPRPVLGTVWRRPRVSYVDLPEHVGEVVAILAHASDARRDELILRCTSLCSGHEPITESWRRGEWERAGHYEVASTTPREVMMPTDRSVWRRRATGSVVRHTYDQVKDSPILIVKNPSGMTYGVMRSDFFKEYAPAAWDSPFDEMPDWRRYGDTLRQFTEEEMKDGDYFLVPSGKDLREAESFVESVMAGHAPLLVDGKPVEIGSSWRWQRSLDRHHVGQVVARDKKGEYILRCTTLCSGHPFRTERWAPAELAKSGATAVAMDGIQIRWPQGGSLWKRVDGSSIDVLESYGDREARMKTMLPGPAVAVDTLKFFEAYVPVSWEYHSAVPGAWAAAIDRYEDPTPPHEAAPKGGWAEEFGKAAVKHQALGDYAKPLGAVFEREGYAAVVVAHLPHVGPMGTVVLRTHKTGAQDGICPVTEHIRLDGPAAKRYKLWRVAGGEPLPPWLGSVWTHRGGVGRYVVQATPLGEVHVKRVDLALIQVVERHTTPEFFSEFEPAGMKEQDGMRSGMDLGLGDPALVAVMPADAPIVGSVWTRPTAPNHVAKVVFAARDMVLLRCTEECTNHPPRTEQWGLPAFRLLHKIWDDVGPAHVAPPLAGSRWIDPAGVVPVRVLRATFDVSTGREPDDGSRVDWPIMAFFARHVPRRWTHTESGWSSANDQDLVAVAEVAQKLAEERESIMTIKVGDHFERKYVDGTELHYCRKEVVDISGAKASLRCCPGMCRGVHEKEKVLSIEHLLWQWTPLGPYEAAERPDSYPNPEPEGPIAALKKAAAFVGEDAIDGAYRSAATVALTEFAGAIDGVIGALPEDQKAAATALEALRSPAGLGAASYVVGVSMLAIPVIGTDPRLVRLSKEFRTQGMSNEMVLVYSALRAALLDRLVPILTKTIEALPMPKAAEAELFDREGQAVAVPKASSN